MNNVQIIGNLTHDPEVKYSQSGTAVSNFSIAYNSVYYKDTEKIETVHFFSCEAWGKLAETISKYVKKGDKIGMTGTLKQNRWEDTDGKVNTKVVITVIGIYFLHNKKSQSDEQTASEQIENKFSDGEVPF